MNAEIQLIVSQLQDAYEGDPWYGRSVKDLLMMADPRRVFDRPEGQHSLAELLWHIITWREFTIDRLQHSPQMRPDYFEANDWRELDTSDTTLWPQGLERLQETQDQLLSLLSRQTDSFLKDQVRDRDYDFRKLLYGLIQHDIYHAGQIAYVTKLLGKKV